MKTTAGEIQRAGRAGLHLIGEEDGRPVWAGSELRMNYYQLLTLIA